MPVEEVPADFDVVIVGFGPTGATLANLLGLHDLKVLVLEREQAAYHLPRAVHFDEEVMRVFQTIGLAQRVSKVARVNPGMKFVDINGELLLDWPRPSGIGPGGWHSSYRFHQPDLERVLREGVARFNHVVVRSQSELAGYADSGCVNHVSFTDLQTGERHSVFTKYLVGCDGGRSTVRGLMQTDAENLGPSESWLVVDVLLNQPMEQLGDTTIQYCNPRQPATYVRCPENRRRWEIAVPAGVAADEMNKPDNVWHLLRDWLTPSQATLERAAVYTFHSMIAQQWRCGRTMIAGDAAHQMPPFMGQGMCAGIRDVANLGWKLRRCVSGGNDDQMLDSYHSERHPHVRAYIETANRLGRLLKSSETGEELRSAMSDGEGAPTMKSIQPRLGPGLAFTPNSASAVDRCNVDGPAGLLATQMLLDDIMLDDVVGYNPLLLIDDKLLQTSGSDALFDVHVEAVCGRTPIARVLTELHTAAVLIRPDRYIYGCADSPELLSEMLHSARRAGVL